jgi:hypothetical protein
MSRMRSRNTTAESIPIPRSRNRGLTPTLTGSEGHPEYKRGTEPPEDEKSYGWGKKGDPVASGDGYQLEYYEDGYPKLPACLDRRGE